MKSRCRYPGAHNAIFLHLVVPVVPVLLGWASMCGVSVLVADRRAVGGAGTAAAAARQCGGAWRQTRKVLSPPDSGCDSVRGARWNRLAATAGGVPARVDGVRDLRALGPRG